MWEEYLAAQHNLTHVEFAVGGATVNNVPSKISLVWRIEVTACKAW